MQPADFVAETANNPGTGSYTLAGALANRRTWASAYGSGTQVPYAATDGTQWETGFGTISYSSGNPTTLSRSYIYINSAGKNAAINFTGAVTVYSTVPGALAPLLNTDGSLTILNGLVKTEATQTSTGLTFGDVGGITATSMPSSANAGSVSFTALGKIAKVECKWIGDFDTSYTASAGDFISLQVRCRISTSGGTTLTEATDETGFNYGSFGKLVMFANTQNLTPGSSYTVSMFAWIIGRSASYVTPRIRQSNVILTQL